MADEKLNTGPAENISPEAAEPIATPEQAAASEPQQEQTGPAIPEPGDVVVSFDKINELMAEKRQNARAEVEKAEPPEAPGRQPPEKYRSPPIRRNRKSRAVAVRRKQKRPRLKIKNRRNRLGPARAAHPRRIRRPPARPRRLSETNCPEVGKRLRRLKLPRNPKRPHPKMRLRLRNRLRLSQPLHPVLWRKASWFI